MKFPARPALLAPRANDTASSRDEVGSMPKVRARSRIPLLKRYCGRCDISLAKGHMLLINTCLSVSFDFFLSLGPSMEPAMNDISGLQEVRSSTSRSSAYRFPQKQRHQFGTASRQLLYAYDRIACSTGISTKPMKSRTQVVSGSLPSGVLSSNGLKDQS